MSEIEQNTETTDMAPETTPEVVTEPVSEMIDSSNEDMPKPKRV